MNIEDRLLWSSALLRIAAMRDMYYQATRALPPIALHPLTGSSISVELHPISNASLVIQRRSTLTIQDRDGQVALVL